MKLVEIARKLDLEVLTPELLPADDLDIATGHASDLLSDVLANAPEGAILVTIQVHMNVVAVASHAALSAVIFAGGRLPEENVRRKAVEERIVLFASRLPTFEIVGRLYEMGIRGACEREGGGC